jgi:hypothetical protein
MVYGMAMRPGRLEALEKGFVLLFFASVFFSLTIPMSAPDLWWHLATGRWMWENGALMQADPFNFVSFQSDSSLWRSLVLKQYWVSQLLFYGVYKAAGFKGLVLMRAAGLTLMFYVLYRLMRKEGAGLPVSVLLLYLSWLVIARELVYVEARPQMWSVLFSVLLVYLLESARKGELWAFVSMPLLMFIWANVHGGYALGDVMISVYLLPALVFRRGSRGFIVSTAAALLASGLNPNGFTAFLVLARSYVEAEAVRYWQAIIEERSLFAHAPVSGIMKMLPYFSTLFLLSLLALALNIKRAARMRLELVIIYALVFLMGLKSIRYIVFFSSIAAFVTAVNLREVAGGFPSRGLFGSLGGGGMLRKARPAAALSLVFLLSCAVAAHGLRNTSLRMEKPYLDYYGGAVNFIKENRLKGNIFNEYTEGGYLIWHLSPDIRVFADGRGLSYKGFRLYGEVVDSPLRPSPEDGMTPVYMSTFWKYGIDLVVIPGCDRVSGITIPLSYVLLNDMRWAVVYADASAIVFMRETPENGAFIGRHALPRAAGYSNILAMAGAAARGGRRSHVMPGQKLSMAIGHMGRGEREQALKWIEEYIRLRPGDRNGLSIKQRIVLM